MPAEYHPTAIARSEASAPVRHLWTHARRLLARDAEYAPAVLDYGCGRGVDAKALRATAYDPWHPDPAVRQEPPPSRSFDVVLLTYVLNVLPPEPREDALVRAAVRVRPGGHLAITVRPVEDVAASTAAWRRHADGRRKGDHFQKGYTADGLRAELRRALGDAFREVAIPPMPNAVLLVLRRVG